MDTEPMWVDAKTRKDPSSHYTVMALTKPELGMAALRKMFPTAQADEMNFVLFSTSGVRGTYTTIKDIEFDIKAGVSEEGFNRLTFLIVQPRLVSLRYGVCLPETLDDIQYLKRLRETSSLKVSLIGH